MAEMMNVRRVAELAKLALSEEEEVRLAADMAGILDFARQLQSAGVDGVPETQHILQTANVLRADVEQPSMPRDAVLSAAPACAEDYIAVPRTVE